MEKEKNSINWTTIIIAVIIGVVILIIAFSGENRNNNQLQTNQTPVNTSTQTSATQSSQTKTQDQATTNENGLACKSVANEAAIMEKSKSGNTTSVVKSHFSQTFNKCFYELQENNIVLGYVQTEIRFAPDDAYMAYCMNQLTGTYAGTTLCGQNNVGPITEQAFKQLENTYFNN